MIELKKRNGKYIKNVKVKSKICKIHVKVKSTAFPPVSSAEVLVPVVPAVAGDGRGQHLDVGQHHETQEGRGGRRYSECCDNSTCDGSRGEARLGVVEQC